MTIIIESVLESAVFFPGDTVFCRVYVTNKSVLQPQLQTTSKEHSISWISAQIYGTLAVEPKYFKLNTPNKIKKQPKESKDQDDSDLDSSSSSNNSNSSNSRDGKNDDNNNSGKDGKPQTPVKGKSNTTPVKYQPLSNLLQHKKSVIGAGISSSTSLPNFTDTGENGRSIFSSPTTILVSEMNVPVGETRSFIYYVTLPNPLPPSFKGTSIKYSYFLSIAAQLYTHPAQILTIPIRVLTPASALRKLKFPLNITRNEHDFEDGSAETPQESSKSLEIVSKWPVSPYKKSQYFPVPYPQTISQYDSNNTRKSVFDLLNKLSTPLSINISKGSEKLATFSICKTAYKLGDSVCGTFDFTIATIPCYKILVKLECEETIEPKYQQEARNKPNRRLYGELHEYTTNIRHTHFMFHIPVEASQEFSTKHVSVRWILRFEFVTPIKNPLQNLPPTLSRSNSMTISPSKSPPTSNVNNNNNQNMINDNISNSSGGNISKSNSYNEDMAKHHQSNFNSNATSPQPQNHHQPSNRIIPEVPSDSESNQSGSSEQSNTLHEETLSNNSSSYNRQINHPQQQQSTLSQSHGIQLTSTSTTPTNKKLFNDPVLGVYNSNTIDDHLIPLVDTLYWSLPIRVFVSEQPHELLHSNRNELIL